MNPSLTLVLRNGMVYDGEGGPPTLSDVGVARDRIAVVGQVPGQPDSVPEIDCQGLAVAPGFINVLSHAWQTIQVDGSAASDVLQGVTTEVFGEGISLGPCTPEMIEQSEPRVQCPDVRIAFSSLGEGLDHLQRIGVATNVASFIGGNNLRILGAGFEDRRLTAAEITRLCQVVDREMSDGALGIATALIYAPGHYATTDELVAVCEVVGRHDGLYISHLRSEGDRFLECLEELISIGSQARCRTQVYHLKAAGVDNYPKMALAIERIDKARADGQPVTADMYPYIAGGTTLAASIPPRFYAGGIEAFLSRLGDSAVRQEMLAEIRQASSEFENLFLGANAGQGILLLNDMVDGPPTAGKRLPEVAALLGITDLAEAALEIVARDPMMMCCYFFMSEDNVQLGLRQPWVSICSDAEATDTEQFGSTHPRAFGSFARVLGHYSRDLGLVPLQEAIRKMTSLPADTLRLEGRGRLAAGAFADIAVFDPTEVIDTATYENPRQYATGMRHVLVNGVPVVRDGVVLATRPGRRLRRGQIR